MLLLAVQTKTYRQLHMTKEQSIWASSYHLQLHWSHMGILNIASHVKAYLVSNSMGSANYSNLYGPYLDLDILC